MLDIARLPQELLLSAAFVGVLYLGYHVWENRVRSDERQKVEAVWQEKQRKADLAWELKLSKAQAKASADLVTLRNQHAQTLSGIHLRLSSALSELRKRADRQPGTEAATSAVATSGLCRGDTLARPDAEFLAREAAGAAEQQAQLQKVTGDYEACRQALMSVTGESK